LRFGFAKQLPNTLTLYDAAVEAIEAVHGSSNNWEELNRARQVFWDAARADLTV
jgi:hypothetical protein